VTPEYLFAFCIDVELENPTGTERLRVACEIETIEDGDRSRQVRDPAGVAHPLLGIVQAINVGTFHRWKPFQPGWVSSNVPWCCLRMKRSTLTEMKRDASTAQRGQGEDDRRPLLPNVCQATDANAKAGPEGQRWRSSRVERRRRPPWQSTFDQTASSKVVDDEVAVESKYLSDLCSCSYTTVSFIRPQRPHLHIPASLIPSTLSPDPRSYQSHQNSPRPHQNKFNHSQTDSLHYELQDAPYRFPQHHPPPITGLCRTSRSCPTTNVRKETGRAQWGDDRQGQDAGL
jgi:hypothetical protein